MIPCNNCGDAVPIEDHCLSHKQERMVLVHTPDGGNMTRLIKFTEHIFKDHHKIGSVWIFGGKHVSLYCDGYEA